MHAWGLPHPIWCFLFYEASSRNSQTLVNSVDNLPALISHLMFFFLSSWGWLAVDSRIVLTLVGLQGPSFVRCKFHILSIYVIVNMYMSRYIICTIKLRSVFVRVRHWFWKKIKINKWYEKHKEDWYQDQIIILCFIQFVLSSNIPCLFCNKRQTIIFGQLNTFKRPCQVIFEHLWYL